MGMSRASVAGDIPPWSVRGRGRKARKGKERKGKQASLMKYGLLTESDSKRWGRDARSGEIAASGNRGGRHTNGFLETRGNQESSYLFHPYFSPFSPLLLFFSFFSLFFLYYYICISKLLSEILKNIFQFAI